MKKARPRFDLGVLRDMAGDKVYARGEAYHRDGQVAILALEPERVLAQVTGTDEYRVELTGRGRTIDGACSCRAFADWGFCKHMVATALAANAARAEGETEGVGALARIRAHLKEQGTDALVAMIVDMAGRDLALFRRLDSAASVARADDKTLEISLRKAIDSATRTGGYVDYGAAAGWAAGVNAVLDTLAGLASGPRAGLALNLVEHAIHRIERAMESIDDSDGHGGALLDRARDIHLAAVGAARPDPVKLARDLFARETKGLYDTFYGAAALYADALGEAGLAEYRRLATEAWNKVPSRMGKRRETDDHSVDRSGVAAIVDFFAKRDGDVEARIAIRAKDLSSPWSYLELAEFCRNQGREQEALRYAEEGLWIFEDDEPDQRLVSFAADLLTKAGRKEEAATHLWRAFEKAPSFEMYARLAKLGGKAARRRALELLEASVAKPRSRFWGHPADLLIRVLTHEKMFDEAWAAMRRHGASVDVKEALAMATEATRPREAIEVYAAKIEGLVDAGGDQAYKEAASLIARMAGLRDLAEQAAYVADIKERFRRRRNFMKLLD